MMNTWKRYRVVRAQRVFRYLLVAGLTTMLSQVASVQAVTFQLVPATATENTFDLELSVLAGSDTDTSQASGTIDVDLQHTIVNSDAVITGIEFTGGQIDFQDVSWSFALGLLQISGTGVAGTPDTLNPPSVVTSGQFNAADHQLTVNQGIFVSSGLANQTVDVSTMPFGGPGSGTGTVAITELSRTSSSVTYDTTVTVPVAFVGRVQETPIAVDLDLSGTLVAAGQWTVALPGTPGDFNNDGIVNTSDYVHWRDNLGGDESTLNGNGDGLNGVDETDYQLWRNNFGAASLASIQSATVPEPNVGALLLMLGFAWSLKRRSF